MTGFISQLLEPAAVLSEPVRRRARLHAGLLITIIFLILLSIALLFTIRSDYSIRDPIIIVTLSAALVHVVGYFLNRAGRIQAAMTLTVVTVAAVVWIVLIIGQDDPGVTRGIIPYMLVSILLSSVLLSLQITIGLAVSQLAIFLALLASNPILIDPGVEDALVFVGIISILIILTTNLRQQDLKQIERQTSELADSEARLKAVLDNSTAIIYLKDVQSRYQLVNRQYEKTFQMSRQEALGKTAMELFPPEVAEAYGRVDSKVLSTGKPLEVEEIAPHPDGERTYISVKFPLHDSAGKLYAMCNISTDISDRKEAEAELRLANEKLEDWIKELEARTSEINLLIDLGELLQSCSSFEEAYEIISHFTPRLFPKVYGAVYLISASRNYAEAVTTWGGFPEANGKEGRVFAPNDCWALRRGRAHLCRDLEEDPACFHIESLQHNTFPSLCVPMLAQGEALGVFHLRTPEGGNNLNETQQQLAQAVAEQLSLALANLRLRETLRNQSIRDPLTGLFNRRYLEETLEREIRRAARSGQTLGMIMLDIDHFKDFNDGYGHQAGDELLTALGHFLDSHVRGADIACRFGGEEFVLMLPEMSLEDSRLRAEELRGGARHLDVHHQGQALGTISLSLGVAVFPAHGRTAERLLQAADEALYRAKHEGRDRVVIA